MENEWSIPKAAEKFRRSDCAEKRSKKMKKLICILMFLAMCITACPAYAFSDTAGARCEKAVSVLTGLGIVEGTDEDTFEPERSISRAEIVTIILRMLNIEEMTDGADVFEDVPQTHWAYANIAAAYQMGIVNGVSDTEFAPDEEVTFPQGVKMLVCALGYGVQAEAGGGYPVGYLAVATQLGITDGVQKRSNEILPRGDMAIMVYNALDIELFVPASYSDTNGAYLTNGSTVLSQYLHVIFLTGRVMATADAEIDVPARALSVGEVLLVENSTGKMFAADSGETDAAALLGQRADFYLKEKEDGTFVILAAAPRVGTEVLNLSAKEIVETTATSLSYEGENKNTQYKVSFSEPTVVYNGSVKTTWTPEDLKPKTGSVKVISDGTETVIIVESYTNYVVEAVNFERSEVSFKEGDSIILDETEKNIMLNVGIDSFEEWGVLSIAKGAKKTKYFYTKELLTGKVTELTEDTATIGGVEYAISPELLGSKRLAKPALGQDCAFYLDMTGAVSAVDTSASAAYKYGILVNAELSKGLNRHPQFKIFTEDGTMEVFETTERVEFADGTSGTEQTVDATALIGEGVSNALYDGKVKRQLIRYELTEDNRIRKIESAADYTYRIDDESRYDRFSWVGLTDKSRNAITSSGESYPKGIRGVYIGKDYGTFSGWAVARANTKFFVMPKEGADDKAYQIRSYSTLSHNNDGERYSNMHFYDVDEDCLIHAMVWYTDNADASASYPAVTVDYATVTAVSKVLNEEGGISIKIDAIKWKNYGEATFTVPEDLECLYRTANANIDTDPAWYTLKAGGAIERVVPEDGETRGEMFMDPEDLKIGDIIQYEADGTGELTMIAVRYRAEYPGEYECSGREDGSMSFAPSYSNYISGISHVTVERITEYGFIAKAKLAKAPGRLTGEEVKRFVSAVPSKILFIDRERDSHWTGTKNDVYIGDTLVRVTYTYSSYMLMVIR